MAERPTPLPAHVPAHGDPGPTTDRASASTLRRPAVLLAGVATLAGAALLLASLGGEPPGARAPAPRASSSVEEPLRDSPAAGPAAASIDAPSGAAVRPTPPSEAIDPEVLVGLVARALGSAPDSEPADLLSAIAAAMDRNLPEPERLAAIRWLARHGSNDAVDVLERLARDDPASRIRVAATTALGGCEHPEAVRVLTALLSNDDLLVVLAAIRSLAAHPDPSTAGIVMALIADEELAPEARAEAAAALGHEPAAGAALRKTFATAGDAVAAGALEALGRMPFAENEELFRELLDDPDVGVDQKLEAIEALSEGDTGSADFLAEIAATGESPELRTAAIDALTLFDEPGAALGVLPALVTQETDPGVRAELYNTLAFHADQANASGDPAALVDAVLAETSPWVRVEGYRMVASMLHDDFDPALAEAFDASMTAWLQSTAEDGTDEYRQLLSMSALNLAGTPGAEAALHDLARSSDPTVSEYAANALQAQARARSDGGR